LKSRKQKQWDDKLKENFFIKKFSLFIFTLALLTSVVIQNKTYFRYATEGARAIRILRQIIVLLLVLINGYYSRYDVLRAIFLKRS